MKKKALVVIGAVFGFGVAATTFFTSKKGIEMKKQLVNKVDDLQEKVKDIELNNVKEMFNEKFEEIKQSINEFDWETKTEDVSAKYFELKDKLKVMKEHLEIAKIKIDDEEEAEISEEAFDLVIDQTKNSDDE